MRTRYTEWSERFANTNDARTRVGRIFSTRFGRLIVCQIYRAFCAAALSGNWA